MFVERSGVTAKENAPPPNVVVVEQHLRRRHGRGLRYQQGGYRLCSDQGRINVEGYFIWVFVRTYSNITRDFFAMLKAE